MVKVIENIYFVKDLTKTEKNVMAETINLEKSGLLENLRCAICIDAVNDARLCPCCSQIFCRNCIQYWLTFHSNSCPNCRSAVRYESMLKGCSIDKIRKSTDQLISTLTDRICNKHKNHQLSLHCFHCEANICVNCWFSNEHKEHKERVVPVEEAFNHYKKILETNLSWINAQKDTVNEMLSQVQELIKKKENINKICETSMDLTKSDAHPETLMKILKNAKQIKKLQDTFQAEKESLRLDRYGDFVPQPILLIFQMTHIKREMGKQHYYKQTFERQYGFEWECQINSINKRVSFSVRLVRGKPSEYSVRFGNEPEKIYRFEVNKLIRIGVLNPTEHAQNEDAKELIVQIRQSYVDKFQQMEDHICRLENAIKNRNHSEAFNTLEIDLCNTFRHLGIFVMLVCSLLGILLYCSEPLFKENSFGDEKND